MLELPLARLGSTPHNKALTQSFVFVFAGHFRYHGFISLMRVMEERLLSLGV